MIRRYNLSHPVGQPMPEDWIHLPDSVVAATDYDALAQLVCDLWHSSAAAHIPPGLQKRVRDAAYAQSVEEQRFPHGAPAVQEVMCEACKGEGAYAGTDRICLTCSGLGTLRYKGSAPAEWPYAQAMCREDLPNAEIVALRVKFYNVERDLEDSEADNVRLRGLLTRIHGIAAEPRPVNTEVRLENIACIASGERDATYAQFAEAQRFLHGAAAVTGLTQQDYDALVRDAMLWRTRSPTGAGGNVKAFVCCEGVGQHAPGCIAQESAP